MQDNSQRILTLTKNKELPFKDARPLEIDERGRRNGWRGFSRAEEGYGTQGGGEAKGCFAASKEETGGDREKEKGNGAKKGLRRRKTKTDGLKEKKG